MACSPCRKASGATHDPSTLEYLHQSIRHRPDLALARPSTAPQHKSGLACKYEPDQFPEITPQNSGTSPSQATSPFPPPTPRDFTHHTPMSASDRHLRQWLISLEVGGPRVPTGLRKLGGGGGLGRSPLARASTSTPDGAREYQASGIAEPSTSRWQCEREERSLPDSR